jgi:DNA-binding MarR family transcriptional regulator
MTHEPGKHEPGEEELSRFLESWLGARQLIQSANFNRFQREGLSATQFMTLNLLPAEGAGMTLSELAARMNLGLATLAKTVDSLESRGMLRRTRSDQDRRKISISLTENGKVLQNAASREFRTHMAALFSTMTAQQRSGLVEGLEALVQADASAEGPHGDGPQQTRSSRRSPKQ